MLPVGLKLYKDKGSLNRHDISLWSQGKGETAISRRLLRKKFSPSSGTRDPIEPRDRKPAAHCFSSGSLLFTRLCKVAQCYKLDSYIRCFESEQYGCLRGKLLVDVEGLFFLQDMTHSLKLSEQQALLGAKNVQGSHGHYESPYYSGSRMLDVPVSSSDLDTTSSVGVFKSRSVIQQPGNSPYVEGLPIWRAALLVVNSALGAGILNFPQAYAECGGIATAFTIQMVGVFLLSDKFLN